MEKLSPFTVISLHSKDKKDLLLSYLTEQKISFTAVEDVFKEKAKKYSFVIFGINKVLVRDLARKFDQEYTLYVDSDRRAELLFDDTSVKMGGKFHATTKEHAENVGVYIIHGNKYYVVDWE